MSHREVSACLCMKVFLLTHLLSALDVADTVSQFWKSVADNTMEIGTCFPRCAMAGKGQTQIVSWAERVRHGGCNQNDPPYEPNLAHCDPLIQSSI